MSTDEMLSRLSKAGAQVGISNAGWWANLVRDYGEPCVLAIVDEVKADTGQSVNVTVVANRCKSEAKRKQEEAEDAAEDAAAEQKPQGPVTGARKGTAAAVSIKPVSVAAAAETHPAPAPALTPEALRDLSNRMLARMGRCGLSDGRAATEIGLSIAMFRGFKAGYKDHPGVIAKITAWLATPEQPAAVVNDQAGSVNNTPNSVNAAPAAVNTGSSSISMDRGSSAPSTVAGEAAPTPDADVVEWRRAAATKRPWGLTKPTTEEKDMATTKQTVKKVEDEIARRGISAKAAMAEIGVNPIAIYAWRKGKIGDDALDKIAAWLLESAKKPAAAPDDAPADDAPKPAKAKRAKRQPAAAGDGVITLPSGDLIERGEDLAQRLSSFGVEPFAQTVRELITEAAKWRKIQSAFSA